MSRKISLSLLTIIIVFGLALRLLQLSTVPPSPDWDEVALGYDAYSIMHTGHDEFGSFMPVVLRSFDDYKPALYAYLTIPSVAILGLTTYAVRVPSVAMGIIGILAIYFLVKELFENRATTKKNTRNYADVLALVSAFLLAVSPWQIQFSRTAFETNTGLTFNLLIGLFFLKGLKKPWLLSLSMLLAGLNLMVYQSERVFTPLLVVALVIIYRKELFVITKKYLITAVIVGLLVTLPTITYIISNPDSLNRATGASLLSQKQILTNNYIKLKDDKDNHDSIGSLLDNRRIIYTKQIVAGYIVHFDPNWLFMLGDNPRHHAPGMGLLYLLDLPFLLIGIYFFLFGMFDKKTKYMILSWLLLAPIPAAVTFEVPHAVRTMNLLPMLLILIAIGYISIFESIKKYSQRGTLYKKISYSFYLIIIILAACNFSYYLNQYFVQQNYFNAQVWQYGYAQAVPTIETLQKQYKKIVVSDKAPLDQSYIFFLFYLRYPPQQYQRLVAEGKNLPLDNHEFGQYEFRTFDWAKEKKKQNILYVGPTGDFPNHIVAKQTFFYPDGSPAILLVDPKNNL